MAALSLCIVLCVLLVAAAFGPVPRIKWEHKDVHLTHFHMDGIFNYSTLLLSEDEDVLYIGAREVVFAVNSLRIAEKMQEVYWKVTEEKSNECARKGKSRQTECLNYIRVLQPSSDKALYVCGTNAFQPTCDLLELSSFQFMGKNEDGKGRCPFDPAQSYTSVMVDGELYSATSYTFLGSEPIIFKHSQQSQLRTEYAVPWLNEPSFVYADVIRAPQNNPDGEDDKVYFFFTEVSVEFDFLSKLLIPRIARVCKGDQGGLRTLQKKWTTFLKAKLICHSPENNFIFNVINDVFILKSPNLREQVIYGVFTSHLNNVGLSAVCAYNVSTVEDVFAKGKYMQSATVEQSHTKWVRFNGEVPKPRPGACINNEARAMNYTSSLNLPDKTLQFVKDHPLIDDSVTPMGNKPKLVLQNVVLTQIVVDRVTALDGSIYDVMFLSTDNGMLHKAVNQDSEMRIIEEIVLFPNHEPVQTLLLSSKQDKHYIYAGSNVGVVQSPVAFCEKFTTCAECVLTRDPYCAWHPLKSSCVNILQENNTDRVLIQMLNGDISQCPDPTDKGTQIHTVKPGSMVELNCSHKSKLASLVWMFNNQSLVINPPRYHLLHKGVIISNVTEVDTGTYQCLFQESVMDTVYSQVIVSHVVELEKTSPLLLSTTQLMSVTEGAVDMTEAYTVAMDMSTTEATSTTRTTATAAITNAVSKMLTTSSVSPLTEILSSLPEVGVGKTLYLKETSDCSLLIFPVVLFFVLFLGLVMYNCYRGFLPDQCLKYRSTLHPGNKKPPPDFTDCEQGVNETLVKNENQYGDAPKTLRDTGYETETDCGNGNIPHKEDAEKTEQTEKDKPFDVKCDLKYADSDVD
ncbi:semaphorin-4D isoform X1 [Spea bombifrons]|uniref:semaphorin-4D isoform X1 n=1 Tax=Spea bombifrons TaxID=233779 RepID=UPI00234A3F06|nr:semaphorin-4D isoform X1 [Spea bombifrons]